MLSSAAIPIIALAAGFLGLNIIFIGLRCYTKAVISKNFQLNDVGMITVLVSTCGDGPRP